MYYPREQVNSYNELDAKLALKDYAASQNKTNLNSTDGTDGSKQQSSASESPRNGTEPQSRSSLAVTTGELPSQSPPMADIKGKKFKSLTEHRNRLKPSPQDISESDYSNN